MAYDRYSDILHSGETMENVNAIHIVELSDTGSRFKWIYNFVIACLCFVFVIPHLIVFALHPKKRLIRSDISTVKNLILSLIFLRHYRNLFYYRIGNIKYLFKWILPEDRSIHVPLSMRMGRSAQFVHNISSFLNAERIGDNFVCYHHVTLGENRIGSNRKPIIGNNVTIYTGAVIAGAVKIGDNVKIGANTVIVKDVPSDSTVVGSPARIINYRGKKVDILL